MATVIPDELFQGGQIDRQTFVVDLFGIRGYKMRQL